MSASSREYPLLGPVGTTGDFAVTTAGTYLGQWVSGLDGMRSMSAQLSLSGASGGTTIDAYLQTSLDGGATAIDIANEHWTTSPAVKVLNFFTDVEVDAFAPTDGSMSSNTNQQGILGNMVRLKLVTVGTYTNTVVAGRIATR